MASSAAEEKIDERGHRSLRAEVFCSSCTCIWVSWGMLLRSLLLQSMAEKLLLVEANPSRPETINSVFLNLNMIPYIRSYIIPDLGLILANLKDSDVLIFPVLICIASCTFLNAKVVFFTHVFVPSEQYLSGKIISLPLHCAASFALKIIFFKAITRFIKSFIATLILSWFLFFLIYSSLHFCIFLGSRFWDQII